jgi:excinuclease UvrABC ATPase subunit
MVLMDICPHCQGAGIDPVCFVYDEATTEPCEYCDGKKILTLEQALVYFERPIN